MKTILLACLVVFFGFTTAVQVKKVTLQASGLTCSMCSKAVQKALQKVGFVDKVQVNIKEQQYNITFKNEEDIDFDALTKAVEDAGFSVAAFRVTAEVPAMRLAKDEHILVGKQQFHFLNANSQELNGPVSFTIVDKSFTSEKNYKKYSSLSKKECVKTGRSASCCSKDDKKESSRVYHAII